MFLVKLARVKTGFLRHSDWLLSDGFGWAGLALKQLSWVGTDVTIATLMSPPAAVVTL